jgi:hypothetical protein
MAHFAKITENNEVLQVLTLEDKYCLDENNNFSESVGQAYLQKHNNWPSNLWIQTSYNTFRNVHYSYNTRTVEGIEITNKEESEDQSKALRGNYAAPGSIWDSENQIFLGIKPYPSWVKNLDKACWESPVGAPPILNDEQTNQNNEGTHFWQYVWNETNQTWDVNNLKV